MAELMLRSDLSIGAPGTTTWERCCLGLPTVMISVAENQVPIGVEVDAAGAGKYVGHTDHVTTDQLRTAVKSLLQQPDELRRISEKGMQLLDGRGAERASAEMVSRIGREVQS